MNLAGERSHAFPRSVSQQSFYDVWVRKTWVNWNWVNITEGFDVLLRGKPNVFHRILNKILGHRNRPDHKDICHRLKLDHNLLYGGKCIYRCSFGKEPQDIEYSLREITITLKDRKSNIVKKVKKIYTWSRWFFC